ncbi:MAG: GGDEF domain-containing protein [Gemmatimonadetes bacterium]|nr:GGDEF domain-containing protein [Gemmatimonadota bacterium]
MALLNDEPRSATVRTLEPTRALMLSKDDFREVVRSSSGLALRLLEVLSKRIRSADAPMGGLSEQALKDPLTGLLNRRAFHERVAEEANRARRYGDRFSLILMDVDQFKSVNDTLGHDVGDEVLRWMGRVLTEHTRAADSPFRVGGEEFAILAPAAGPEVARAVANRIRTTIAESTPPVESALRITVSGGYVTCPDHGRDADSLYHLADQALFRAKIEGRDRIADPQVQEE